MRDVKALGRLKQVAQHLHSSLQIAAHMHMLSAGFTEAAAEERAEVGGALD